MTDSIETRRATRFKELAYRCDGPNLWRFVTTEDGATVGPHYKTEVGEGSLKEYALSGMKPTTYKLVRVA